MGIKRPKTKKFSSRHDEGQEIVENIKQNTIKNTFMNFRIQNKFKLNPVHKEFFELLLKDETKMTFLNGPAGSCKSYLSVYAGLQLLKDRKISQIVYIRSIAESASKSIGMLPGELESKFLPYTQPLMDKIQELVGDKVGLDLIKNEFIKCIPVNFCRGLTFRDSLVILEESQNFSKDELITCITRFGENSKFVIIGDEFQADIGNKSGFHSIKKAFDNKESIDEGIYSIDFGENEIVRSKILKFIVKKLESSKKQDEHIKYLKRKEQEDAKSTPISIHPTGNVPPVEWTPSVTCEGHDLDTRYKPTV